MSLLDRFFGPPTEDQFAELVIKTMKRAGDTRQTVYDKEQFQLLHTKDGEAAGVTNLRNLYKEYCSASRKDRTERLNRACLGLLNVMDLPDDFDDIKPDLMPTLRPRCMFEEMDLNSQIEHGKALSIPWIPVTEHVVICLVYDLPNSMRFVTQEDLDNWNTTLYEAAEIARQNLAEREFPMMAVGEHLFLIQSGDAYDATRVLLVDIIEKLPVKGNPLALPITRDTLLITGTEDEVGLPIFVKIAKDKEADARPLCPIPMQLVHGEWETWTPTGPAEVVHDMEDLRLQFISSMYSQQKELLDKLHEQTETDVFVATWSAMKRQDEVLTFSVWSKSVPTWLPKTDYIALFDPDTETHRFVNWDAVVKTVGPMLQPLDLYPDRWFVDDFPSEDQINAMPAEDWMQ